MADAEHLIVVPENIHPWNLVFEVAEATDPKAWVLVGGLMVHAHAIRAGVNPPRPTGDIDILIVSVLTSLDGYYEGSGKDLSGTPFEDAFNTRNLEPVRRAGTLVYGST